MSVPKHIPMIVIGFTLIVLTKKGDMYVNVEKDFMEMGYLVLVCMISYKL